MRVAGLDVSTSRIGYADPSGGLHSITARAGAEDKARRLHELKRAVERAVVLYPPRPDLVVIEGYAPNGPNRWSLIRLGEIGGVIRAALFDLDIPFREVPPKSLKLFATGKGNADKVMMVRAVEALDVAVMNDDEADAFHARRFGLCSLGMESVEHEHEARAIRDCGVRWR